MSTDHQQTASLVNFTFEQNNNGRSGCVIILQTSVSKEISSSYKIGRSGDLEAAWAPSHPTGPTPKKENKRRHSQRTHSGTLYQGIIVKRWASSAIALLPVYIYKWSFRLPLQFSNPSRHPPHQVLVVVEPFTDPWQQSRDTRWQHRRQRRSHPQSSWKQIEQRAGQCFDAWLETGSAKEAF